MKFVYVCVCVGGGGCLEIWKEKVLCRSYVSLPKIFSSMFLPLFQNDFQKIWVVTRSIWSNTHGCLNYFIWHCRENLHVAFTHADIFYSKKGKSQTEVSCNTRNFPANWRHWQNFHAEVEEMKIRIHRIVWAAVHASKIAKAICWLSNKYSHIRATFNPKLAKVSFIHSTDYFIVTLKDLIWNPCHCSGRNRNFKQSFTLFCTGKHKFLEKIQKWSVLESKN